MPVDLVVVLKKMGCRHSKPESGAKAPPPPPHPHPPPPPHLHLHPCPCPCPCPFPYPPPPNSHWGPKSASRPVSIPSSMPSLETASLPSSKVESAPAPAKIGIFKSSESVQLEDMQIKVRHTRIKTEGRSIRRVHCKIKMRGPHDGKEGSA